MAAQEEPEVGGGLLVKLDRSVGRAKTPAAVAAQWFAQNIFKGADADDLETDAPAAKRTRTATASLAIAETAPSPKDPDKPLVPKAPKAADGQVSVLPCITCFGANTRSQEGVGLGSWTGVHRMHSLHSSLQLLQARKSPNGLFNICS